MFVVGEWEGTLENFRFEEEEEVFFLGGGGGGECNLKKYTLRQASFYLFSPGKFMQLFLLKKVKPLPIRKIN